MKTYDSTFVAAARVRQALVGEGDIRGEIEFQNDINGILARIDDGSSIFGLMGWAPEPQGEPQLAAAAAAARRAGQVLALSTAGRRGARAEETGAEVLSIAAAGAR